ncbi:MAG TPA: diacylglycerol kinase family protein [Clostridia bacterium]|nr:diacylglycerol kinase family protein [Clostridia bacterium]
MNKKTSSKIESRKEEEYERPFKSKNFIDALKNAVRGVLYTFRKEKNIKIQLFVAIIVIILALILKSELIEIICLLFSVFFVLFAEMLNTALETTIDLITKEYNIKAKIAKDVMAGAVLIATINSVIVGLLIFPTKILNILF